MASFLYDGARELAATVGLDWVGGTFHGYLLDIQASPGYTADPLHDFLDNVNIATVAAGPISFGSKTAVGGACDANDMTFPSVPGGSPIDAILIVKLENDEADSPLVAYLDNVVNLPITPNGGDLVVVWSSGANKIFRL